MFATARVVQIESVQPGKQHDVVRDLGEWSRQGGRRTRSTMYSNIGEIAVRGGDIRARCSVDSAQHTATSFFVTPFPG